MKKLRTIFCGTPDFAIPTLDLLLNHPSIDLSGVVTMPDRKSGRGQELHSPPVATFAKENKIPLFQTENLNKDPDLFSKIQGENIDLIIVLAFAQFLSKKWLEIPKLGCFNIHTSLLPKYRGAAPIQYALLNGDHETGVSIQKMVSQMDAGDIVAEKSVQIDTNETGGQLYTRLKFEAALTCNTFIQNLLLNKLTPRTQSETEISFAPTLTKDDGLIRFKERTFTEIHNQVRALKPWPGTFCFISKKRVKIIEIEKSPHNVQAGNIEIIHGTINVGTKDAAVRILSLQLEGKSIASDKEFLNGIKNQKIDLTLD